MTPTRFAKSLPPLVLGALILSACTSEIVTSTGGQGGGGSGGSAGGSGGAIGGSGGAAGGAGGATGGMGGAIGGAGGSGGVIGNLCDQACAKAAGCGLPLCQFAGIDCSMPGVDCPAECILDADCGQIGSLAGGNPDPVLGGCLQACQGGGGQGGGGGGSPVACGQCSQGANCQDPCFNDMQCQQEWGGCAFNCFQNDPNPACFSSCNMQFPQWAATYDQVYGCVCMACAAECGSTVDPCNQGSMPGSGVNGDPCMSGGACLSGFCADAVCCDTACSGACERCDGMGTAGTCSPLDCVDPDDECNGPQLCSNGACVPANQCP